jgi:Fe2+ transport system protein FeoA
MKLLKEALKYIYEYCYRYLVKPHLQINNCSEYYDDMIKLSIAVPGVYKFVVAYCGGKLGHRLLEMGFVPEEELTVVKNAGLNGSIVIKLKGSKIVLSNKIADKCIVKKRNSI